MLLGRDFNLFFVGATLSAIGTALVPVALSFAVIGAGYSASALGMALAAQALPTVVLLLFGGVLGDRWPRRRIMIWADLLRFVAQSLLALALIRGEAPLPVIIGLTALIGVGTAFFYPARGGLVAQIVAKERLTRANGALSAVNSFASILGPILAGILVASVGSGWAIGLDGLTYAVSALCLVLVRQRGQAGQAGASRSVLEDLRLGLAAFGSRRWLWIVVAQFGLLNLIALAPFMVAPVLLAGLPHGAQNWGMVLGAIGVGGLAGAVAVMRWQPARAMVAIQVAVLLLAAPLFLLAATAAFPLLLLGGITFGAGGAVVNVMIGTLIQREIPTELLSRVFSIVQIAAGVLAPAGYALAGPAATWLGPHRTLAAGAGIALASVAGLLCLSEVRQFGART
ncbi:MFS transporter [Novosphingobium sp. PC22D]|uniref:MFS transporter n=1 Tax=Novosphingobium sp. PC22D TaxID=1962403 RepID=UPI00143A8928|nr:MFS transporter [Novosphingobium sp. PC22D]